MLYGVREEYNIVLIDTPPSLRSAHAQCSGRLRYRAGSDAMRVLRARGSERAARDHQAREGAASPALEIEGLVLTMFDSRNRLSHEIAREVREHFADKVFKSIIPAQRALVRKPEPWSFGA